MYTLPRTPFYFWAGYHKGVLNVFFKLDAINILFSNKPPPPPSVGRSGFNGLKAIKVDFMAIIIDFWLSKGSKLSISWLSKGSKLSISELGGVHIELLPELGEVHIGIIPDLVG